MKRIIAFSLLLTFVLAAFAQRLPQNTMPPKRELRSAWVSTVWGIDWPKQGAPAERQNIADFKLGQFRLANEQIGGSTKTSAQGIAVIIYLITAEKRDRRHLHSHGLSVIFQMIYSAVADDVIRAEIVFDIGNGRKIGSA